MNIQDQLNLAIEKQQAGDWTAAEAMYRRIVSEQPEFPEGHYNFGTLLDASGRWGEAIAAFEMAARLRPAWPVAHWNLGLTLLRQGELERGWREYEWRWQVPELRLNRVQCRQPLWDGLPLNGRRILLYAEQGFGDTIQFSRYVPLVAERGGRIMLGCQPELAGLLEKLAGVEVCLPQPGPAPADFAVHCPLGSLPRLMGTTLATIPDRVPYLAAETVKARAWAHRLAGERRLKIGLAWAGRPTHRGDRARSLELGDLPPLANAAAGRFISLQKGEAAKQAATGGFEIADWTDELNDFGDTAALIANLDLVICVDTSVAHLAGAMGRPAWVLLPFVPDWRWMLERADSPWYPTMRLFRQPAIGDWQTPLRQIAEALRKL